MLKYLEDSEALKVSTRELKEKVLCPNQPSVNIYALRGRREVRSKKLFQISNRQGANEILIAPEKYQEKIFEELKELEEKKTSGALYNASTSW